MQIIIKDKIKNVVVVCHYIVYGPPDYTKDYLLKNGVEQILFIKHPNLSVKNNSLKNSIAELYFKGKKTRIFKSSMTNLPEVFSYIKDLMLTLFWTIFHTKGKVDLFIGAGNLSAFAGLILKLFGKVNMVVYYAIDYIPKRFKNNFINKIYHIIDKWRALYSTVTWNYGPVMIKERQKKWKCSFPNQIIISHGVNIKRTNFLPWKKVHRNEMVYLGFLHKFQGIKLAIDSTKELVKYFSNIRLNIIGKGDEYETFLRDYVKGKNLEKHVKFLGFIEDSSLVERIIRHAVLGIATYEPSHPYIKNADPGKIKTYLSCGVPVITTNISNIANEIKKNKAGFVIPYRKRNFINTVSKYLKEISTINEYRKNAFMLAQKYNWNSLLYKAIDCTISLSDKRTYNVHRLL